MKIGHLTIRDNNIIHIADGRYAKPTDITDGSGRFGNLVYTLLTENIQTLEKPEFVPYKEHYAGYDSCVVSKTGILFENCEFQTTLRVQEYLDEIVLEMECQSDKVSACGMFLPLNFMSNRNGEYASQFLISSPYHTIDRKYWMHYFTRPDGKQLVLIAEGDLDGYKINYSPYLSGHFIRGFSFLWQLDQAYGLPIRKERSMRIHIVPVENYEEAVLAASKIWKLPALLYDVASAKIGTIFPFETIGMVDEVKVIAPSGKEQYIAEMSFVPEEYGIYTLIPYRQGTPGMDVSMFAWDDMNAMYGRAMDSLITYHEEVLGRTKEGRKVWRPPHLFYRGYQDHNLCEHGMWCWALLRYMEAFEKKKEYIDEVQNHLSIVMEKESDVSVNCCTISKKQGYHTLNSTRIQEVYNGVNILLDAYKVFDKKKYLELAIKVLEIRIESDISKDGAIMRFGSDGVTAENADYTTVTCMVFPIVDLAVLLKGMGDRRYLFFQKEAIRIADFVVKRGFLFPTEGGEHREVNREMEEGSISCSALTVLYVAKWLCSDKAEKKKKYLEFAERILKFHDAFTVSTPHPVMFRSSLRWWETIWEGDSDGPAVCFGHAWSIWRAEAQFLYGIMAKDNRRILDSYNGFFGNYAKEQKDGRVFAIYQYEPISGGAVTKNGSQMNYHVHDGFPDRADDTTSRYLFARDFQCWQRCAAIVEVDGKTFYLGCHMENEEIVFDGRSLEILYMGVREGVYLFRTQKRPRIICTGSCVVEEMMNDCRIEIK